MQLCSSLTMPLEGLLDVDWASDVDYRRSTSGLSVFGPKSNLPVLKKNTLFSGRVLKQNIEVLLICSQEYLDFFIT